MPLRFREALRESTRNARAHWVTTMLLALVTASMTSITFLTAGQAAAVEAQVIKSVEETGPRLITVNVAQPSPGLDQDALARFENIDDVEWVLALGEARDVASPVSGLRSNVAARDLVTILPNEVEILEGRVPNSGEAILGREPQRQLQLDQPSGIVLDGSDAIPIVGSFVGRDSLETLDRLVIVAADEDRVVPATLVYILAEDAEDVTGVVRQLIALAGLGDPDDLTVETSDELVQLGLVVSGQVGSFGRQLALGAIAAGMVLIGLTTSLAVSTRKKDLGRRRALGASRSAIVGLGLAESALPALGGSFLGALVGLGILAISSGQAPSAFFITGTLGLMTIAGTVASIPALVNAAWQDPLKVLRVP